MDLQQAAPNGDSHQSVCWILITKHQNQQQIIPDIQLQRIYQKMDSWIA